MQNDSRATVYVVMGGQFGSEGKGEFVSYLSHLTSARHVVRTGGPNAGHTVTTPYGTFKMRQIPSPWWQAAEVVLDPGWVQEDGAPQYTSYPPVLYIGPGSLIAPEVLMRELAMIGDTCAEHVLPLPSIYIDQSAVIIDEGHVREESDSKMRQSIGSTTEGIGAARSEHIMRSRGLQLAGDAGASGIMPFPSQLREAQRQGQIDERWGVCPQGAYPTGSPIIDVLDTAEVLNRSMFEFGEDVIVESTQGFGLSLVHSGCYPFATSRDVTPGIILNDAGLPTTIPHEVIAVVRTMPIRVAGNSGPLEHETTWEELQARIPHLVAPETTTVTGNVRRIADEIDMDMLERMVMLCRPHGPVPHIP